MKPDHLTPTDEKRAHPTDLEVRDAPAGSGALAALEGYAAVFNRDSRIIGKGPTAFVERIAPGAFARAIRDRQDVKALVNHDPTLVLGRTKNGTLALSEDAHGLRVRILPADTTYGRDVVANIRRKDVDAMSFGFRVAPGGEAWNMGAGPGGVDVRTLTDVDLFDVSPTSFPAYEDTAVAVRSLEAARAARGPESQPELRDVLALTDPMPSWGAEEDRAWHDRHPGELRSCFHGHLGLWLMEPDQLRGLVAAAKSGQLKEVATQDRAAADRPPAGPPPKPYGLAPGGVAVVRIAGTMAKASKFGETSTVAVRRAIREAAQDPEVRGMLLVLDSGGGQAAGTAELGAEVRRFGAAKPIHAFVEDCAASAAYWVGSQAQRMSVNPTGMVGSIGVVTLLWDESKRYEREGVKVHVVATGEHKAALREGQAVRPEDIALTQERIDFLFGHFRQAVQGGRGLSDDGFRAVSDGRMFPAPKALEARLVDAIGTQEEAMATLVRATLTPLADPAAAPPPPLRDAAGGPPLAFVMAQQAAVERSLD